MAEDQEKWQVMCPIRCGVIKSWTIRHNTKRYGMRMAVMQHLRNKHNLRGREVSILADKTIKDLPRG